jgi:uncharacterized protein YukJ
MVNMDLQKYYREIAEEYARRICNDELKLFKIAADYRPSNPNKPIYYLVDKNKSHVKKRFLTTLSYMKIYQCEEVDKESAIKFFEYPMEYPLLFTNLGRGT